MKKTLLLNILLLISFIGSTQTIKQYVRDNFYEVQAIDPNNTNYADLAPIGDAIDESQVVFLGEQDHGDTRTILAKIRLIKYLHEKHGFNIIAFESDFFGLNMCSTAEGLQNIHGIWRGCAEYNSIEQYYKESLSSSTPIQITGFDCRHHSQYSKQNLVDDLDSIFQLSKIKFKESDNYYKFQSILDHILENEYESKIETNEQEIFYRYLDTIRAQLHLSELNYKEFWIQEMLNLEQMVNNSLNIEPNEVFSNIRDKQMAENLLWLTNTKFKGQKIIVWAASFHIVKDIMKIEDYAKYVNDFEDEDLVTMGDLFNKNFSGKSYHLGFTCYEGSSRYRILKAPPKRSFESILHIEDYDYGFINLKNSKRFKPFLMNGTNHIPYKSDWSKNFDGIFYIREMNSCYNQ